MSRLEFVDGDLKPRRPAEPKADRSATPPDRRGARHLSGSVAQPRLSHSPTECPAIPRLYTQPRHEAVTIRSISIQRLTQHLILNPARRHASHLHNNR